MRSLFLIMLLVVSLQARGQEKFAELSARTETFKDVLVLDKLDKHVQIRHSKGVALVRVSDLAEEIQRQLGYDPNKVRDSAKAPIPNSPKTATPEPASPNRSGMVQVKKPGATTGRTNATSVSTNEPNTSDAATNTVRKPITLDGPVSKAPSLTNDSLAEQRKMPAPGKSISAKGYSFTIPEGFQQMTNLVRQLVFTSKVTEPLSRIVIIPLKGNVTPESMKEAVGELGKDVTEFSWNKLQLRKAIRNEEVDGENLTVITSYLPLTSEGLLLSVITPQGNETLARHCFDLVAGSVKGQAGWGQASWHKRLSPGKLSLICLGVLAGYILVCKLFLFQEPPKVASEDADSNPPSESSEPSN